jgi:GNAT superfamily N-acetyltransferase
MITDDRSTVTIGPATLDQVELAARIYQAAAQELHGRSRASNPWANIEARNEDFQQANRSLRALLDADDGAVLIARDERGQPAGMAAIMIHPPHAHLAFLFVSPDRQNQGIGRALLDAVSQRFDPLGVSAITLASSRDPKAWQRYLRWGLRPGPPQLPFRASHPIFPLHPPAHSTLIHRPVVASDLETLVALDRPIRGGERRERIAAWLAGGSIGELVLDPATGQPRGYALVHLNDWFGQIGPVVALDDADFPFVLDVALTMAGRIPNPEFKPWRVDCSARNHLAVDPLLAAGFTLESIVNWFETGPVGQWDRYLFRDEDEL